MTKNMFAMIQLSLMTALSLAPLVAFIFPLGGQAWFGSVVLASVGTPIALRFKKVRNEPGDTN